MKTCTVFRVDDQPPFVLLPLSDGRYELRAFSDNTEDPIVLVLDETDGNKLGVAVAQALVELDTPGAEPAPIRLSIAGRDVTIYATSERGLQLTVGR